MGDYFQTKLNPESPFAILGRVFSFEGSISQSDAHRDAILLKVGSSAARKSGVREMDRKDFKT